MIRNSMKNAKIIKFKSRVRIKEKILKIKNKYNKAIELSVFDAKLFKIKT